MVVGNGGKLPRKTTEAFLGMEGWNWESTVQVELRLMMNVQCDKNNFHRYIVSRGNLDLLLNGLGNLMTKHTRGETKALLPSLLTPPVSVSNEQA